MNDFLYRFFGYPFGEGDPNMRSRRTEALGSGVVVDRAGYILTNNHVVDKADRIQVKFHGDVAEYEAKLVGADPVTDLAVIRVTGKNVLEPARIGNSDARAGGRLGGGDRIPVRLPGHRDRRHHQRQGPRSRMRTGSFSVSCRPTPPSTRATAAARC